MQWFFALTEDSTAFRQYAEMIMVAVHTAKKFTSLVPNCIYDGGDNDFTAWLTKHGVRIVPHRSFVREPLAELGRRKGNPHLAAADQIVVIPTLVRKLPEPLRRIVGDLRDKERDLIQAFYIRKS